MKALAQVLLIVLVSACGTRAGTAGDGRSAVEKAARYLWSKQGPDGGWHSETYGLLRSGQSLTPFVLLALLESPGPPHDAVDRALAFIRADTNAQGEVGRSDPSLEDYPNYSTSLALRAFLKAGKEDGVKLMASALARQQFQEGGGWSPEQPAYGGWGMGGPMRKAPYTGHVDLSMTRHVLQALSSERDTDELRSRARRFLERCQNADGGFMFSPVILDANKAGTGKSTGTSTADGILSLASLGLMSWNDARRTSALAWLERHHRVDGVPGFDDTTAQWRDGMMYYYLSASAQAFRVSGGGPEGWRKEMIRSLEARQRDDGSFKNASFLMKEDDPLIATTFALLALISAT